MQLKYIIFIIISSFISNLAFSNAAAPGFFNLGGIVQLKLFYPKDSVYLDKIQMKSEQITIFLYKGYAVVKGEYYMLNLDDKPITIRTGYPINSYYRNNITKSFDITNENLFKIKVFSDNNEVQVFTLKQESNSESNENRENWYVWENTYQPNRITKLTVYYIVNTNNAIVRSGYNRDYVNGFAYLLESGNCWAKTIEQGRIYIKLLDNLQIKDISGILPVSGFKFNKQTNELLLDFTNLKPTVENNILIKYYEKIDKFDFNSIINQSEKLYSEIDKSNTEKKEINNFQPFTTDDIFQVKDSTGGGMLYIILVIVLIPLVLLIAIGIAIIMIVKRIIKKKKQRKP